MPTLCLVSLEDAEGVPEPSAHLHGEDGLKRENVADLITLSASSSQPTSTVERRRYTLARYLDSMLCGIGCVCRRQSGILTTTLRGFISRRDIRDKS